MGTCLNDDLQTMLSCSFLECLDFICHKSIIAVLQSTNVDDHINFFRSISNSILDFKNLDCGRVGAQWEADDTGWQDICALQLRSNKRDPACMTPTMLSMLFS